ncbi:MAG: hypothetical protein JNJ88_07970 [Planctomycetes bacterium]|nr:hypothetical protein [Planctomycetota bacterium]
MDPASGHDAVTVDRGVTLRASEGPCPMKKVVAPLVLLLGCAAGACRSTQAHQNVVDQTSWNYGDLLWTASKDAFHDLFDVAYVNVGLGDGLLLDVQATKVLHGGLGWADTVRWGTRPRSIGAWSQRQAEYGLSLFYWRDINRQAVWGTEFLFDQSMSYKGFDLDHQNETGHWTDLSVHAHVALVGVEADVAPKEVIDFTISFGHWVWTLFGLKSAFHELGLSGPDADLSGDDSRAAWREAGGSAAGAIYQGDTPFYERSRNVSSLAPPVGPAPKK